jgi:twitching motility protein PilT
LFQKRDIAKLLRATPLHSEADARGFIERVREDLDAIEVARLLPFVAEYAGPPESIRLAQAIFVTLAKRVPGPELFSPGVRALKHADQRLRQALVELLPHWNDVNAHGELVELLASNDSDVRTAAADVLKHVGGRTALQIAEKRAKDPAFLGRADAINAFIGRAGHHALGLIRTVIAHGRPMERIFALRQLADPSRFARDPASAIDVACTALEDKDDLVLAQAITALGELGDPEFLDHVEPHVEGRGIDVLRAFMSIAARTPTDSTAAYFQSRFRDGPKTVRLMILDVIEKDGSDALFATVVEALSHRDLGVRTRAAHVVGELSTHGRVDAARAIVWLLRAKDVNVRRLAAEIANRVQDRDGSLAPKLLGFLRDEDWWVRERVLDALVEMDAPGITKHLIKDYLSDESSAVRRFAVNALIRLADPRTLGALVRTAQTDTDWLVRDLAVEAIGSLGDDRAAAYLVDLAENEIELRVGCLDAIRKLRAVEVLPDVAHHVGDEDSDVRLAAVMLLDALDDGTHALWAKGCEDDPSKEVREVAGRLLRRFKLEHKDEGVSDLKSLDVLLSHMLSRGADDLLLFAGRPPYVKASGRVEPLGETQIGAERIRELLESHLTATQLAALEARKDVDFSYELASRGARFRVNVFHQLTGIGAVFRTVKADILTLGDLGIPKVVAGFANLPNGLVLVGGPTGAGKSTTLAALIDHINRTAQRHIVTIEDPIEMVHAARMSVVNQRELGQHTRSFANALRSTLRQDPDVILVGELRDLETISFAVTAAETGHLVLGSVHTTTADATVDRLINSFPARQQAQVRGMLAESLRAVTCQYLLRTPDGGRQPAVEVMINNEAIQSLIRKGKSFQIPTIIATSRDIGMQQMDVELIRLAKEGKVVVDDAYAKCVDKRAFEAALGLASPDAPVGAASISGAQPRTSVAPQVRGSMMPDPVRPSVPGMQHQSGASRPVRGGG